MARIKYVRVSTTHQNTARQEVDQDQYDKIFIDKASGKNTERPGLKAMLDYVRDGDVVVIESYSRLARSMKDLLTITEQLDEKGVVLISQKEQLDTSTATGRLILNVLASLSQFERELMLERQAEGIKIAKEQGKMGRPRVEPGQDFQQIVKAWQRNDITGVEAMKRAGLTKSSFYRRLREMGIKKPC